MNNKYDIGHVDQLTIIERMFGSSSSKKYEEVDLSNFSEKQLEKARSILFKERFNILYKGFT